MQVQADSSSCPENNGAAWEFVLVTWLWVSPDRGGLLLLPQTKAIVDADVVDGADPVLIMKSRKTDK